MKLVFQEKSESYLFCYNAILKDRILFKQTHPSIEIDVIVVKKHNVSLNFVCKIKVKNVPIQKDSEYASGPKHAKIVNMANLWIWLGFQYASVTQRSEYARICLDRGLNIS